MSKLSYYVKYKTNFEPEVYLCKIKNDKWLKQFASFQLGNHNLAIETGRYNGISRENKLCEFCNMHVLESEYHFLLVCPKYSDNRNK